MTGNTIESLKERCRGISLGIFAGDPGNLRGDAQASAGWGCGILHFDVMDGVFVPQISGGPGFVKALAGNMIRDVHLMVQRPADHVTDFVAAGADIVTVQAESEAPAEALRAIRKAAESAGRPVLAGLCLLPDTAIDDAGELLAMEPDLLLVAALDPRGKQPPDVTRACGRVAELRQRFGPGGPLIQFDGGVTAATIGEIANAAPDMVVSGSAVMRADDPAAAFRGMKEAL
ncbi:ribulose-phosphate 3-epimerase [Hoeflea poritis]|uniref:Ribulose-phosphate 3-epimerase n=1 Tax=Hoeflea poritis TaxID=2993659 RepID=A0ABT4VK56_9HYPH|nr:hypothetical protein [Hoeflea poritis]MDA4845066.1 hypothetical protein [Hoeflea poritis]